MSSGGLPTTGPRHGRHRRGEVNSAWTPAVRPTEAGHFPTHARVPWGPLPPDDDTSPLALVPRQREPEVPQVAEVPDGAVVHVVPDTPPHGLRKFDLGIVPASVTPPRSWRKAALFAVGTSAAVICGLAVAAVRLMGTPSSGTTIDALPAFPTQELGTLPIDAPTRASHPTRTPASTTSTTDRPDTARRTGEAPMPGSPQDSAPDAGSPVPGDSSAEDTGDTGPWIEAGPPPRTTIGPEPVTPTNPEAMGDRTMQYFALVTDDPQAAHDLCTGGMAREGPAGIEARYQGVAHVEVQDITVDRNQAVTTSTVKIVRDDGTALVEERKLTFTWGSDPKISDDAPAG
jgi:hypothetical protein